MLDFIAFDVETTGIDPVREAVVEVAGVRFKNGIIVDSFSTLINPERPIPPEAARVHGITDQMVKDQPTINQVLPRFADFCGSLQLVAHNAPFDCGFLSAAIKRYEETAPSGIILDTLSIARKSIPRLASYSLGNLIKYFEVPHGNFHRAKEDSACCGQLFVKLVQRLSKNGKLPPMENIVALSGGTLKFPQFEPRAKQLALF